MKRPLPVVHVPARNKAEELEGDAQAVYSVGIILMVSSLGLTWEWGGRKEISCGW